MIEKLISKELARASKGYGETFASAHEGESVIREEIKEVKEEYVKLKLQFNDVWQAVRSKDSERQLAGVERVRGYAKNAIKELIQVCAMCDKFTKSFGNAELANKKVEDDTEERIARGGAAFVVACDKTGMFKSATSLLRKMFRAMEDACVLCGDYVPEGRMVCPTCEEDPYQALRKNGVKEE